ncbi:restriction endonuclease subunit S [uncultured Bacteroides sp.]|uniref:restriction endonuclease subunit S n=1 Tax=uncultured Bacteroides sp. TaxID=162156 RepID=UPI002595BE85|nr:restriction endonuclease subunit S [uncultured Bacteroides sp.]
MATYRFDEIAINSTKKKKPTEEDKAHYIGLEHIDPGCFNIVRWGSDVAPTGDKLLMQKGDVLFGKRRAYQRKVGIAPFDGIFSAHGMVLRPNTEIIDANYFPFFISSDRFMETAVRISVGGLSPTINWKDLAKQEFDLPTLEEQKVLADKLWAAYRLKEAYKKLLAATDEMVKSQFIEMFGDSPTKELRDVCIQSGEYGSNTPADTYDGNTRYVRITDINDYGKLNKELVSPRVIEEKYLLTKNDLLFARTGNTVGKTYLHEHGRMIYAGYLIRYRLNKEIMLPEFAFAFTHTSIYYDWVERTKKVGAQPNISAAQYDKMPILVPSMGQQRAFVAVAEQADKSKSYVLIAFKNLESMLRYCIGQIA